MMKWLTRMSFLLVVAMMGRGAFAAPAVTNLPENRILLFNDYALSNTATQVDQPWVLHDGPLFGVVPAQKALLPGTNHFHRAGWRLTSVRAGTVGAYAGARIVPPVVPVPSYPLIASNLAANLRNDLGAYIESPVLSNGVGTVYFEAINAFVDKPTEITVEIATNMWDAVGGTNVYTLLPTSTNGMTEIWETLSVTNLSQATASDFIRYVNRLNCRVASKLRIRRSGSIYSGAVDAAFAVVDNVRVSPPPSDVSVYALTAFNQAGNFIIRGYVSNADTNVPTDARTVTAYFRWANLAPPANAWTNAVMELKDAGDGAGNGERYELVLPPQVLGGDLEYNIVCDFSGYAYQSPDYTGMGYSGYLPETVSPFTTAVQYKHLADANHFTLTVENGTGGGAYTNNQTVAIAASNRVGRGFSYWTGATQFVADALSPTTTVSMPNVDITVTAKYTNLIYTLTVNNGSGSGLYEYGQVVPIEAPQLAGQVFDRWTGDVQHVADVLSSNTVVTIPDGNVSLTATYLPVHTLTVNGGSGGGAYTNNAVVVITADAPPASMVFDRWIGNTSTVANVTSAVTTVTMPASNLVLTATYVNVYALTVNNGGGDGFFRAGTVVTITADPPAGGTRFDRWTGNTATVASVTSAVTTVTMPASNVALTAAYVNIYHLTVNSGGVGGDYTSGQEVPITANAPTVGMAFARWTGATQHVVNALSPSTVVIMPPSNIVVTATYSNLYYTLTANNGSGGGAYTNGQFVAISAIVPVDKTFDKWSGDTAYVVGGIVTSATVTVRMPAADITLTALFSSQTSVLPDNRFLHFNDYTNSAIWTHEGSLYGIVNAQKALLAGTNHFHRTGWRLFSCRTGSSAYIGGNNLIPPKVPATAPSYPTAASNLAANLRNDLGAQIESPVFTNGVGMVYFEAINSTPAYATEITVEISTNMYDVNMGTNIYTILPPSTNNLEYVWAPVSVLQLAAATSNDFTRFNTAINFRGPAKIRIRRTGNVYDGLNNQDAAFSVVDNLRVSLPPSDVILAKTTIPFEPGYPGVGTNVTVRCYVSNADMNAPTDSRSPKVVYRWRFLNQQVQTWRTNDMSYVVGTGDGHGNGELYEVVLSQSPFSEVGDLEYYFLCEFGGYVYIPPDYTGMNYTGYPSENLSPRLFRYDSEGREFTTRLRPYASRYDKLYIVPDTNQFASPIEMTLVGDNEWRGMVPIAGRDFTDLRWRFLAQGEYVPGSGVAGTGLTWWAGVSGDAGGRIPYGGICAPTNETGSLRVLVDEGNYILATFNTETLQYLATRGEYQDFNQWPAPPNVFTESNGQDPKHSYLNTFDSWPVNQDQTFMQAFAGYPTSTNVFMRDPFYTLEPAFMAGSAAYVSERTMVDNTVNAPVGAIKIRNLAMRLKGGDGSLGLGYIYNTASTLPDGLKDVTFKARLGQKTDNYDVSYYRNGFTNFNYLVRATAKTVSGPNVSPQNPFVSLIGYYTDPDNFYEYRVSQINDPADTAANPLDRRIRHELYKWKNGVATRIGGPSDQTASSPNPLNSAINDGAPLEMAFFNEVDGTRIVCRFGTTVAPPSTATDKINVTDKSLPFTSGTFGYFSEECASSLSYVRTVGTVSGAFGYGGESIALQQNTAFSTNVASWYLPAGRYVPRDDVTPKGIYSVTPSQQISLYEQVTDYVADGGSEPPEGAGSTTWRLAKTVTVNNFAYQTFSVNFNAWRSRYVMLQVAGGDADVVVDEINVSSWHGRRNGQGWIDRYEWVAYESWVVSNSPPNLNAVYLDHSRGDPAQDQAIRSQLLDTGLGLMEFDYLVHRAPAKLTVQYATERDTANWKDVGSLEIGSATGWLHASAYLGTNAPGYFRLLNAREGIYTNAWVEIDNVTVWDEPTLTNNSWRAYNVKITSTDTNRVALDESKACFLNNSPYLEADPPQTVFEPYLRSPELPKGLGKLSFQARAYTNNQAATLYVYASTNGWNAPTNQWFELTRFSNITNGLYKLFTYEMEDGRKINAIKLGTKTRAADRRVCLENVTISEPVYPGFNIENVQLIDLISGDGQPTEGEEVHIQAQITNIQMIPSNIQMYVSYYVGSNHWGIGNWPAGEYVTLLMTNNVSGDSTLYRTVPKGTPGFPPSLTGGIPGQERDKVIQYYVWAEYDGGIHLRTQQETFMNPEWYYPVDLNASYAAQGWSPYYIVYGVPRNAVFINEVNALDYVESGGNQVFGIWDNAYIELAIPSWLNLAGWSVELVANDYSVINIPIPAQTPEQTAVTNGYAFFVIADEQPAPGSGLVPLPKVDLVFPYLKSYIPMILPGGLRLKRPMGMYEESCAYNYTNEWGEVMFSGAAWAASDPNPQGRMVYVGRENVGGSLGVISGHGQTSNEWFFPMTWTPGAPNAGQIVPPQVSPGAQSIYVISLLNSDKATQNGLRGFNYTLKLPKGGGTNIVYQTDPWYRLFSVKKDSSEQLPSLGTETNFNLVLSDLYTNVEVAVNVQLRSDIADQNLDQDVLNWLLGFEDGPLIPMFFNGQQLTLTEQYWLDADPTQTNLFDLVSTTFISEPGTNFHVSVKMELNGEKKTALQGGAVLKLQAKGELLDPKWEMLAQYSLTQNSFDTNNTCRVFVPNPYDLVLAGWDPEHLFLSWIIELNDPRVSTQVLVNDPE